MGWINFVVIPEWKILIPISRHTDELPEYLEKTLDSLINDEEYAYDLTETKVKDLNLRTLHRLLEDHEIVDSLKTIYDADIFLLYWLKKNRIDYEIISEYEYNNSKQFYKDYKILPTKWYEGE